LAPRAQALCQLAENHTGNCGPCKVTDPRDAELSSLRERLAGMTSDRDTNSGLLTSTLRLKDEIAAQRDSFERQRDNLARRESTLEHERDSALARATDAEARMQSLFNELFDGAKAHSLFVQKQGREGERLINAYCGGIVRAHEDRDAALAKLAEAERKGAEFERGAAAMREALESVLPIHHALGNVPGMTRVIHPTREGRFGESDGTEIVKAARAALDHPAGKGFVRRAKRAKDVDPSFPYCAACGGTVNDHLAPDGGGCEGMFIGAALQPVTEGE
jgi:hypothetical protein